MNKTVFAFAAAVGAFALSCRAANLTEIANADFESGDEAAVVSAGIAPSPNVKIVGGSDAIDGKYSVMVSAPEKSHHLAIKFPVKTARSTSTS